MPLYSIDPCYICLFLALLSRSLFPASPVLLTLLLAPLRCLSLCSCSHIVPLHIAYSWHKFAHAVTRDEACSAEV